MAAFSPGDRVAWSHEIGPQHAEGSLLVASALPPNTPIGTVIEAANEPETWFVVEFAPELADHPMVTAASETHPEPNRLTLTADELVRVKEA